MSPEIEKQLAEKFPHLLPKNSDKPICLHYGINCEDGWKLILQDLLEKLELIREETGATAVFSCIKEKFGVLHAYYDLHYKGKTVENLYMSLLNQGTTHQISGQEKPAKKLQLFNEIIKTLIEKAQAQSTYTCEVTGFSGVLCHPKDNKHGWKRTLSEETAIKVGYIPVNPNITKDW